MEDPPNTLFLIANPCRAPMCALLSYQTQPYCHAHTRLILNLRVRESRITHVHGKRIVPPMMGLFAAKSYAEPAVILQNGHHGLPRESDAKPLVFGPDVVGIDGATGKRTGPPGLIVEVLGETLDQRGFDSRYPPPNQIAPYVIEVSNVHADHAWYIDQARLRGLSAYANDPAGPNPPHFTGTKWSPDKYPKGPFVIGEDSRGPVLGNYNAEFRTSRGSVGLYATRLIYDGDEIFVDYGRDYWQHWGVGGGVALNLK